MSTARPTRRGSSACSVSVKRSRRSVTVACERKHWRSRDEDIALAAVGGNLPLSARAASASVPSDALTAARQRNDQRIAANNLHSLAVVETRPPARSMHQPPGGPPRRRGGVGTKTALA